MLKELSASLCGPGLPSLSGNIYCVGRNYADHAKELQNEVPREPLIFLKAPAALRPFAEGPIAYPGESFHHEVELVLLIGRYVALGAKSEAKPGAIAAIGIGLDLTRREVQEQLKKKGHPWTLAKSFAGSALLHPLRALDPELPLENIDFRLDVNGEGRQTGKSSDMLFGFTSILQYLVELHPLYPGDLIYTGTPAGVGPLRKGDTMRIQSQKLGIDAQGRL